MRKKSLFPRFWDAIGLPVHVGGPWVVRLVTHNLEEWRINISNKEIQCIKFRWPRFIYIKKFFIVHDTWVRVCSWWAASWSLSLMALPSNCLHESMLLIMLDMSLMTDWRPPLLTEISESSKCESKLSPWSNFSVKLWICLSLSVRILLCSMFVCSNWFFKMSTSLNFSYNHEMKKRVGQKTKPTYTNTNIIILQANMNLVLCFE